MKTTIILGAGASKPYGFPLGPELKQIVTQYARERSVQERLKQLHYQPQHLDELVECLRYGRFPTVDEFLDAKKSFREIGGYIIAESILNHEVKDMIFPARDWLAVLYTKLHRKIVSGEPLNLTIITLNSDRTVEYFFSKVTRYDCREDEEEKVAEVIKSIPILHPHGSLGPLSELSYGLDGGPRDASKIRHAGKRIQIISDKLEDSAAYTEAQNALEYTDRILFIGFAYHPSTMESLLKKVDLERTELIGTSLQLSKERADAVTEWSRSKIKLQAIDANVFIGKNII